MTNTGSIRSNSCHFIFTCSWLAQLKTSFNFCSSLCETYDTDFKYSSPTQSEISRSMDKAPSSPRCHHSRASNCKDSSTFFLSTFTSVMPGSGVRRALTRFVSPIVFFWIHIRFAFLAWPRRLTCRLTFRIMITSTSTAWLPFAARFGFRWWARLQCRYFLVVLCRPIKSVIAGRSTMRSNQHTSFILFMWSFTNFTADLIRASLPTICWARAYANSSGSGRFSTLPSRSVSKEP